MFTDNFYIIDHKIRSAVPGHGLGEIEEMLMAL